jgi:hypothetical protein
LLGSRRCEALGIAVSGHAPVLKLCGELIAAGIDQDRAIHVYREGGVLALKVRSIGEAAGLVVEDDKNGRPRFRLERPPRGGGASPMRKTASVGPPSWPTACECLPNRCRLTAEQDCAP